MNRSAHADALTSHAVFSSNRCCSVTANQEPPGHRSEKMAAARNGRSGLLEKVSSVFIYPGRRRAQRGACSREPGSGAGSGEPGSGCSRAGLRAL